MKPQSRFVVAGGLRHHVLVWSASEASPEAGSHAGRAEGSATAVLVHGYMDAAGTWDLVAPALAEAGLRVLAPDMRGFGEGPRVPPGGYYHFADYVADLSAVVEATVPAAEPLFLVGHSMGGTIATYYAGAFPERVTALALLEGFGPPDASDEPAAHRMRRWIDDVKTLEGKRATARALSGPDEAFRRLAINHPFVPPDVLRTRVEHLARREDDGTWAWRFDPLHRTMGPAPFLAATYVAFAARVACPVLALGGGAAGFHPPDEAARLAAFSRLDQAQIEDAGHMMHWSRPAVLGEHLVAFWRRVGASASLGLGLSLSLSLSPSNP